MASKNGYLNKGNYGFYSSFVSWPRALQMHKRLREYCFIIIPFGKVMFALNVVVVQKQSITDWPTFTTHACLLLCSYLSMMDLFKAKVRPLRSPNGLIWPKLWLNVRHHPSINHQDSPQNCFRHISKSYNEFKRHKLRKHQLFCFCCFKVFMFCPS